MVFEIDEYELTFGNRKLFLVTGFQFGEFFVAWDSGHTFRLRVFPTVKPTESVKLEHIINVFETYLHEL